MLKHFLLYSLFSLVRQLILSCAFQYLRYLLRMTIVLEVKSKIVRFLVS